MGRYISTDDIHITGNTMVDEMGEIFVNLTDVRKSIDQTPTTNVVDEIIELLNELKYRYLNANDIKEMWAIWYAISLIEKKYKENGK